MKIGFFGGGKMAEGILSAIPKKELKNVIVAERFPERCDELRARFPEIEVTVDVTVVAKRSDLIFLAVRPVDASVVGELVKPLLTKKQTLVSIVAGKKLEWLRKWFGEQAKIIRVMPNLCLRVGEGMCVLTSANKAVEKILGAAGRTLVLPEKNFDAVTALSGSGPAFFTYFAVAMVDGGVKLGLTYDQSKLLALQTMYGTAKYLLESNAILGDFLRAVATPGGTTAAGMDRMVHPFLRKQVAATLAAAAKRSADLA